MGKGPNSIYKDCLDKARNIDKELSKQPDDSDIQYLVNKKFNCVSLMERDVRLAFFEQNYSDKATDRSIKQWLTLNVANRIVKNGYSVFIFLDWPSSIKGA